MKIHRSQRITRLLLFLCLLMISLALPMPAVAQNSDIVLENVLIDIWPEYDQPSVLVITNITLSPQVTLPATMSIRIPSDAEIHAVAMQDPNGLYTLNYQPRAAGQWVEIVFTAPVPDLRIEYYDPFDRKEGAQREYTYTWPGNYTANNLTVQVQQPRTATEMNFRPELGSGSQAGDGLTYYGLPAGNVTAGTAFDLVIQYNKPDDTLTSPGTFQPAQPNQPVDNTTAGRVNTSQLLPWVIAGVGLLLIIGGVVWYTMTGRAPAQAGSGRRRHLASPPRSASAVSTPTSSGDAIFCSQCGKKAGAGDLFCRSCGTKIR